MEQMEKQIVEDMVIDLKSYQWPVAKKVSNLAQSFGRENTPRDTYLVDPEYTGVHKMKEAMLRNGLWERKIIHMK